MYSTQSSPYCTAYGSFKGELGYSERSQLSVSQERKKIEIKNNNLTILGTQHLCRVFNKLTTIRPPEGRF